MQRSSHRQSVYETLRLDIKAGRYMGGARLVEEEIARKLGVSRTPVREALSQLFSRGLLEQTSGGLVVRALSHSQVLELYSTRAVLEGAVASFAARHSSPFEIVNLDRLHAAFVAARGDLKKVTTTNREFHNALYEAAHNEYIKRLLEELNDSLALMRDSTFTVDGRYESAIHEHQAILSAIVDRDPRMAEEAARRHIQKSTEARLQLMSF